MYIGISLETDADGKDIYGLSARNRKGERFDFRQFFNTRAEAEYHQSILKDFLRFTYKESQWFLELYMKENFKLNE